MNTDNVTRSKKCILWKINMTLGYWKICKGEVKAPKTNEYP